MAEFLIKKIDATNPDSEKDERGCYKRGDVVQVYEDGECKEPPSPNSKMYIVKAPGMSKENAEEYVKSHIEPRPRTEKWNALEWAKAEKEEQYQEFISKPSVLSETEQQQETTVNAKQWTDMQAKKDYNPFWEKPTAEIAGDKVNLSGIVRTVELQGEANTVITRRKYHLDFAVLESKVASDLEVKREATITATQAESSLKLKV